MVNPLLLLCAVITTQRRVVVGMFVWFGCVWCWVPEFWFSRTDSFERKPALLLVQTKTNGFHYPWVLSVCPNIQQKFRLLASSFSYSFMDRIGLM